MSRAMRGVTECFKLPRCERSRENVKHVQHHNIWASRKYDHAIAPLSRLGLPTTSLTKQTAKDFSTLPAEILAMVMLHVARNSPAETKISPHLFKARLISKAFSDAAIDTFSRLVRCGDQSLQDGEKYAAYSVLHLPPKSGSMHTLARTFSEGNTVLRSLVTEITYHVTSALTSEVAEESLIGTYDAMAESGARSVRGSGGVFMDFCSLCPADELARHNIETFTRLCSVQRDFIQQVQSAKGTEMLAALLSCLSNLNTICFDVVDFWQSSAPYANNTDSLYEQGSVEYDVYQGALPAILKLMTLDSNVSDLRLKRVGSAAFLEFPTSKIKSLGEGGTFLRNLVNLELTMTQRDEMEWNEVPVFSGYAPLRYADRVHLILQNATNLQSLKLGYSVGTPLVDGTVGSSRWLQDVLHDLTFPKLARLELGHFAVHETAYKALLAFLMRHQQFLDTIILDRVWLAPHLRHCLLEILRQQFDLSSASVIAKIFDSMYPTEAWTRIVTEENVPVLDAWRKIVQEHGVLVAASSIYVDVGSYLVGSASSSPTIPGYGILNSRTQLTSPR